jgi:hypothetical protein
MKIIQEEFFEVWNKNKKQKDWDEFVKIQKESPNWVGNNSLPVVEDWFYFFVKGKESIQSTQSKIIEKLRHEILECSKCSHKWCMWEEKFFKKLEKSLKLSLSEKSSGKVTKVEQEVTNIRSSENNGRSIVQKVLRDDRTEHC